MSNSKIHVCRVEEIPHDEKREFTLADGVRVLVLNCGGDLFAYPAACPHQDVPLCEGLFDGRVLTCHQHLWQWDARTGEPLGLAEAPLQKYEIRIEGGAVSLSAPETLKVTELFADVHPDTLDRIKSLARSADYPKGTCLYRVGDAADDLHVLDAGQVEFVVGRENRLSQAGFVLRQGEAFGWTAILSNFPHRLATARCLEDSRILSLRGQDLLKVLEDDPKAGYSIMRRLAAITTRYLAAAGTP